MNHRFRLGKKAARHDPRTLRLARYVASLPPPPSAADWTGPIGNGWGMMKNDVLGDCTCAAAGHLIQLWTTQAAPPGIVVPDEDVVAFYSQVSGYTPSDPSTDEGAVEIEVLNSWRNLGVPNVGHKIAAYAAVNLRNPDEVRQTINLFGGIYLGVALPISAQNQATWDLVSGATAQAGSWGGHAVPAMAYDEKGLTVITWGAKLKMSWAFLAAYADEGYAIITPDWIKADGLSPSGLDLAALQSDLVAVSG